MSDLKPCPFCGGDNVSVEGAGSVFGGFICICSSCGISSEQKENQEQAIATWNTRLLEDELRAENQRLRDCVEAFLTKANMVQDDLQEEHGYYLECVFMGICAVAEGLLRTEPEEE
jgi:Lar family restriction alleviation protein